MPPSVALNGQVTIQVIKCLKCQQVQKPSHAFLMVLYLFLCLCFCCLFCPLLLIQLCGTAPARTCQCWEVGGGAGNPKQSRFMLVDMMKLLNMTRYAVPHLGFQSSSQTHITTLENYSRSGSFYKPVFCSFKNCVRRRW